MTKIIHNTKQARIEIKDGRKVLASISTVLPPAVVAGILAGLDPEADQEATLATLAAAIEEASRRKGSVVPNEYRYQYGVDQSCGDDVAKALTAKVTDPKTGVDLEACRVVAGANGVEDKFDAWLDKGLNPGMVRMNLGNVLRGKARRGEPVVGL